MENLNVDVHHLCLVGGCRVRWRPSMSRYMPQSSRDRWFTFKEERHRIGWNESRGWSTTGYVLFTQDTSHDVSHWDPVYTKPSEPCKFLNCSVQKCVCTRVNSTAICNKICTDGFVLTGYMGKKFLRSKKARTRVNGVLVSQSYFVKFLFTKGKKKVIYFSWTLSQKKLKQVSSFI